MKTINRILLCIIAFCSTWLLIMTFFLSEHQTLILNIRELKKQSGAEFLCPVTDGVILCVLVFAIAILIFNLTILNHKRKPIVLNKILIALVSLISAFVIFLTGFLYMVFEYDNKYFCFYSPGGENSFIAYEWSFLFGGRVELYKRTSPITIKKVGECSTDDGYRPISLSGYEIIWNENSAEFTICDGSGGTTTQIIEFKE